MLAAFRSLWLKVLRAVTYLRRRLVCHGGPRVDGITHPQAVRLLESAGTSVAPLRLSSPLGCAHAEPACIDGGRVAGLLG